MNLDTPSDEELVIEFTAASIQASMQPHPPSSPRWKAANQALLERLAALRACATGGTST